MGGLIIDVGANKGDFCIPAAIANPDWEILAFEPVPELCGLIRQRARSLDISNLTCLQLAIDETSGAASFHVSRQADWGVSSLLKFNQQNIQGNAYWNQREDLFHDSELRVRTSRLSSALRDAGYSPDLPIFMKIDIQGKDLVALESLDDYLGKLIGGVLEAPSTVKNALYEDEPWLLQYLLRLVELGFEIDSLKPNDPACAEMNVSFKRKGEFPFPSLDTVEILSEKNYWHFPSSSPKVEFSSSLEASAAAELLTARSKVAEINASWNKVGALEAKLIGVLNERNQLAVLLANAELRQGSLSHLDTLQLENFAATQSLQLQQLLNSKSWKVTKPLRKVGHFWRRLKSGKK